MFQKSLWIIFLGINLSGAQGALFPFEEGNHWQFQFERTTIMGGSNTDSGIVDWKILSVETMESNPPQYRITVEQKRGLQKRTTRDVLVGCYIDSTVEPLQIICEGNTRDTVYNPPLVTLDTLTLYQHELIMNGYTIDDDTCWQLIDSARNPGNKGMVTVTDTSVDVEGQKTAAVKVDPAPCRTSDSLGLDFVGPGFFVQVEGVGPVARYTSSSPLFNTYMSETWSLVATNVNGGTPVNPGRPPQLKPVETVQRNGGFIHLPYGNLAGEVTAITVTGNLLDLSRNQTLSDGKLKISLPEELRSQTPWWLQVKSREGLKVFLVY